jgi:drug/metabolite transporter (DMT)-like permease
MLLSPSVLWGGSFCLAKVAVGELGPLTVVFGRVGLAAVALNLVLAAAGRRLVRRGTPWRAFFLMGLVNNLVPFSLSFWAPAPPCLWRCVDPERHDSPLHAGGRPLPDG